jgi:hypothetical protein
MKTARFGLLALALASAALLSAPPYVATASAPAPAVVVLQQEGRWLKAITAGDGKTVASILAANYVHITSQGKVVYREQELASLTKEPFTMNATEETVDFAGKAAVVHGLNTIVQSRRTLTRERFTDVFVNSSGTWRALSAQETAIAP